MVGTISASDEDPFDTFTYSLVSGTGSSGNAAFTISGNTLQTAVLLNAEAQSSYSIRIRATDASGLYTDQVFTISVTHTNVPPVISNTGLASPPSPNQAVTIQSTVTDEQGLTSVDLTYYNETQFPTSTPFAETFGTTATAQRQLGRQHDHRDSRQHMDCCRRPPQVGNGGELPGKRRQWQ